MNVHDPSAKSVCSNPTRKKKIDLAIQHPTEPLIAIVEWISLSSVRNSVVKVFDMDTDKYRTASFELPKIRIRFAKWINAEQLAIVSKNKISFWNIISDDKKREIKIPKLEKADVVRDLAHWAHGESILIRHVHDADDGIGTGHIFNAKGNDLRVTLIKSTCFPRCLQL